VRAADALRLDGHRLPIAPPGVETATTVPMAVPAPTPAPAAPEPAPAPVAALPELPPLPELAELAALATIPEPAPVAEPLQARVPDLPAAADLDFDFDLAPAATPAAAEPEVGFDLDLDAFDAEPVSAVEKTTILPTADEVPDAPLPAAQAIELDLADLDFGELVAPPVAAEPAPPPAAKAEPEAPAEPAAAAGQEPEPEAESGAPVAGDDEQVKVIGLAAHRDPAVQHLPQRSRRAVAPPGDRVSSEWGIEHDRRAGVPESSVALAHSLAGSSATVGYAELSGTGARARTCA
jgi:chemosensory pili system protein ChpA (sensor histidine kinase/response regulator)